MNVLYSRLDEMDESATEALAVNLEERYTKLQDGRPSSLIRDPRASRLDLVSLVMRDNEIIFLAVGSDVPP